MRKKWISFGLAAILLTGTVNEGVLWVQADTDFAAAAAAAYEEPEMKYRPYARWWLAEGSHTDETLRESVKELYDAGYGGVEFVTLDESQYLADEDYAWGSAEWIHDTKVIIEACHELGMSVSMTSGTHWATANLISITPDDEAASQELGYTTLSLTGKGDGTPTSYTGYLPYCKLPGGASRQTLVKVLAARVTERGNSENRMEVEPSKIDISSLRDITDQAVQTSDEGIYGLRYTAEDDSDYEIFAFYQYGTGEAYRPAVSPSYTINYLSAEGAKALIDYWDANVLTEDVQTLINDIDECGMYMDSLELGTRGANTAGTLWCADMLSQFSDRNGYDMDLYLPLLIQTGGSFGSSLSYFYEPDDEADQKYIDNLRRDFFQTQTELYTENCLEILADWLHSKNMKLRAENSYGQTFEISQPAAALDYIETESMEFANEIDSHRNMAGAAHLFNKRMSSETGAWVSSNYRYNNEYYRNVFYMQYAAGVQKTVIHGYSSEYGPEGRVKWPGYEGMGDEWSERFNKRQPAAVDYPELNLHFSRIQKLLEEGVPQMDLAILRTDYAFNNSLTPGGLMAFVQNGVYSNRAHNQDAYYWRDMELQNTGYTYDYFSPYLLTDERVCCSDGLINAEGAAYQALILMQDELPVDAAEKILAWAEDGLPVVFVNHAEELVANENVLKVNTQAASVTGSNAASDEELAEIVAKIKALNNVRTVESEADACEALQELGILPRVKYVEANTRLLPVLRSTDEADYLYLYHYMYEDTENYQGEISLEGTYVPYILNTWDGSVKAAENYACGDGRTNIKIDIAPGEVLTFVLRKNAEPSGSLIADSSRADGYRQADEQPLRGWELTVDSFEEGEKLTRTETNEETGLTTTEVAYTTDHREIEAGMLENLVPWKELESVGDEISGIGRYTVIADIPDEWLAEGNRIEFFAESFGGGTAGIYVNGQKVSVNMDRCSADVTPFVTAGENTIQVDVTSSLRNVMVKKGYESGWIFGAPEPDAYGMTGETKLILYQK